jgi:glycosyltransferase involved in cell wall biosynthesis
MALSISFVVPAYNEERNIKATAQTISQAIAGQGSDYEIILVNDASSDSTNIIIDSLAATDSRIHALHNLSNLNLGGAYKRGLSMATKEYVIMVPGDNGFGVESLREVLKNVGRADILIPYPTNWEVRTPTRRIASRVFTGVINGLFGFKVRYYNGPVVHRTILLRTITIATNSFAYQAEALVKMLSRGYSYAECPVQTQSHEGGRSSAMKLKNQITVLTTIIRLLVVVGPRCIFSSRRTYLKTN